MTIAAIEAALGEAGEVVRLEATEDFPLHLKESKADIVFNVAEGLWGPNREAHVPALCEFWGFPTLAAIPGPWPPASTRAAPRRSSPTAASRRRSSSSRRPASGGATRFRACP